MKVCYHALSEKKKLHDNKGRRERERDKQNHVILQFTLLADSLLNPATHVGSGLPLIVGRGITLYISLCLRVRGRAVSR